jgi:hypothetical protein
MKRIKSDDWAHRLWKAMRLLKLALNHPIKNLKKGGDYDETYKPVLFSITHGAILLQFLSG